MDSVQLYDGTTTIDLNDGSAYQLIRWQPSYDGQESIRFQVLGTGTQIATRVRAIEAVLDEVIRWRTLGLGARWRAQWTPSGLSDEVESEIWYDERRPNSLRPVDRQSRKWELSFVREPFWRGARVEVELSNAHGSGVTGGLQVDNTDDSSRDNWVEIDEAEVMGDMPALTEIQMTNNDPGSDLVDELRLGLRVKYDSGGSWRKFVLENDEAGTILGSQSSGATYSGGNYHSGTLGSGYWGVADWSLTETFAKELSGYWRIVARGSFPDDVWVAVEDGSETFIYTAAIDGTGPFLDLGVLRLPPWQDPQSGSMSFTLGLYALGPGAWWLDYVMLLPAHEGFRKLWYTGPQFDDGDSMVDDGIKDEVGIFSGSDRKLVTRAAGKRVALVPGFDQRIYFYQVGTSGGVDCRINRQMDVAVYIVPRYRFFED